MSADEPIVDRSAARAALPARFRDEHAGPPNGTEVALRCSAHGTFLHWVSPPAPPCRVGCGPACPPAVDDQADVCAVCRRPGGLTVLSHEGPDGYPVHPECLNLDDGPEVDDDQASDGKQLGDEPASRYRLPADVIERLVSNQPPGTHTAHVVLAGADPDLGSPRVEVADDHDRLVVEQLLDDTAGIADAVAVLAALGWRPVAGAAPAETERGYWLWRVER